MTLGASSIIPVSNQSRGLSILWIAGTRVVGGAERVTLQLIDLLVARGHRVSALHPSGSPLGAVLQKVGIPASAGRLGGSLDARAIWTITRALSDLKPDIALITTADEWVWGALAHRPSNTRLILVRHMALALPRNVTWLANRRADAVVAVSEAVRGRLIDRWGIASAKLKTIPNPVRLPIRSSLPTSDDRRAARNALNLRASGCWLGFFGGADPQKGVGDLLLAAARLHERGIDIDLLLAGRGFDHHAPLPLPDHLTYPNADRIHLLGQIDDMATALTACDAIAMPTRSSLSEGLPLVVLEAMACGTPVVAYATGGAREALADDPHLLARPDDPDDLARLLGKLLTDETAAQTVAARGLDRARNEYAPELAADRYESLFLRLRTR
jgi:glycosyltransferase involved in cell wall biosynthesis